MHQRVNCIALDTSVLFATSGNIKDILAIIWTSQSFPIDFVSKMFFLMKQSMLPHLFPVHHPFSTP